MEHPNESRTMQPVDNGKLDLYLIYPAQFWQLVASFMHLKVRPGLGLDA